MQKIIQFCVERPVTTSMMWLALMIFGAISLENLKVNLMPNLEFPKITILTTYPNASPDEVETLITKPLTDSVGTIGGIEKIESESSQGLSTITLRFTNDTEIDFAIIEVRERVDLVRDFLPQSAARPLVTRFDPSQGSFQEIVFFPKGGMKEEELRTFIEDNVKVYLERIEGLAVVQLSGGYRKEIAVKIDPKKMVAFDLALPEVKNAILSENVDSPAGSLPIGNKELLVRTVGRMDSIDELRNTVIGKGAQGGIIQLSDFAAVNLGYKERTGIARYNGKECILAYLFKESGKNSVELSDKVKETLISIEEKFSRDLRTEIVYDESQFIKESIAGVSGALVSGAFLAFLILVVLLRNIKSPLILLTVIPASLFTTFLLFYIFDISLNMMSLGGLALGIGMLFDTSNVVFSAIERNLSRGSSIKNASIRGTLEVSASVISATLTTVIVFLPIIFIKSVVGIVFAEMALAISISLVVSLIASITIIPMLSAFLYRLNLDSKILTEYVFKISENFHRNLLSNYEKRLSFYLDHPKRLFLLLLILFSFSVVFVYIVPKEFIPEIDTGEFSILINAPRGTKLENTSEIVYSIESSLLERKEVERVISKIGYEEDELTNQRGGEWGTNRARMRVILKDTYSGSTNDLIKSFRDNLIFSDEIQIYLENTGDVLSSLISGDSNKLSLEIQGEDLRTLNNLGKGLISEIKGIKGLSDIRSSMEDRFFQYALNFDSVKSVAISANNSYLSDYMRIASQGEVVTKMKLEDKNIDVRLAFQKESIDSINDILQTRIKTPSGETVQVSQIGKLNEDIALSSIIRSGNSRVNLIKAELESGKASRAIEEVEKVIENYSLPEGYNLSFSGEKENIERSFQELLFAFLLAAVLIYMLLSSQFESLKYSLVMICTIPLMFIGVFPGLFLFGKSLNVSSFMGLVLLLGVVVDNATLYYEYVQLISKENIGIRKVIIDSGKIVLRPILMNNSTTILGLFPIMLELQKGTEFQSPMAIVVIIGLFASFFFSLYLIPLLFYYLLKSKPSTEHAVSRV